MSEAFSSKRRRFRNRISASSSSSSPSKSQSQLQPNQKQALVESNRRGKRTRIVESSLLSPRQLLKENISQSESNLSLPLQEYIKAEPLDIKEEYLDSNQETKTEASPSHQGFRNLSPSVRPFGRGRPPKRTKRGGFRRGMFQKREHQKNNSELDSFSSLHQEHSNVTAASVSARKGGRPRKVMPEWPIGLPRERITRSQRQSMLQLQKLQEPICNLERSSSTSPPQTDFQIVTAIPVRARGRGGRPRKQVGLSRNQLQVQKSVQFLQENSNINIDPDSSSLPSQNVDSTSEEARRLRPRKREEFKESRPKSQLRGLRRSKRLIQKELSSEVESDSSAASSHEEFQIESARRRGQSPKREGQLKVNPSDFSSSRPPFQDDDSNHENVSTEPNSPSSSTSPLLQAADLLEIKLENVSPTVI